MFSQTGLMAPAASRPRMTARTLARTVLIATLAFLSVVDLFATQAILPVLVRAYGVSPARMSFAVNASTIGMAVASLGMALFGHRVPRRLGVIAALVLLAVPTLLLSGMPDLAVLTALRILQGLCMATAFVLTLAWLAETSTPSESALAFAAYITGNVASNLFGRLMSAAVADHFGLSWNFLVFAALNLCGGMLAFVAFRRHAPERPAAVQSAPSGAWRVHLADPSMLQAFAIGFCILFAFIGTFTYVNFALVREPFSLPMMRLGAVYLVFLPSVVTTLMAGRLTARWGARRTCVAVLGLAFAGLPLLVLGSLNAALLGLVLVGVGTFLAQATATGYVGRAARADRAVASGFYLASYFSGGLVGSLVLGQVHDRLGWTACVAGVGAALLLAAALASRLREVR
jgi:predicted MFS family arabinose efflux permease